MSLTFPSFAPPSCMTWRFAKRAKYATTLQRPQSMRRPATATLQQSAIYELELTYDYLKNGANLFADDVAYITSFYEACRGGFGWFTFDPSKYSLDTMSVVEGSTALRNGFFGVGDGVTTAFQLWRSSAVFGGGNVTLCEMIQNVTNLVGVYNGAALYAAASYALTNFPAMITFASAPASGANLSWAGDYSYLCRFAEDVQDMEEFMYQLWELKSLKLETINL